MSEPLVDETKVDENLTLKQERFCRNYTQNYELYGNSTLSYAEAYGYDLESMSDEDGVYRLPSGVTYYEHEQESLLERGIITLKEIKDAKLIERSTYKKNYDYCSSFGSRLRKNDKIQARCRELLNEFLRDEVIDARLAEIVIKGEDKDSINAIKEYNKLKQRIVEKQDITSAGERIMVLPAELINKNETKEGV